MLYLFGCFDCRNLCNVEKEEVVEKIYELEFSVFYISSGKS